MPRAQDAEERPNKPLHFLHCTCDLQGSRKVEQRRSSCRDVAGAAKHTTPWMEEVEPRREQRSRTCESGHPWRSDVPPCLTTASG